MNHDKYAKEKRESERYLANTQDGGWRRVPRVPVFGARVLGSPRLFHFPGLPTLNSRFSTSDPRPLLIQRKIVPVRRISQTGQCNRLEDSSATLKLTALGCTMLAESGPEKSFAIDSRFPQNCAQCSFRHIARNGAE